MYTEPQIVVQVNGSSTRWASVLHLFVVWQPVSAGEAEGLGVWLESITLVVELNPGA